MSACLLRSSRNVCMNVSNSNNAIPTTITITHFAELEAVSLRIDAC